MQPVLVAPKWRRVPPIPLPLRGCIAVQLQQMTSKATCHLLHQDTACQVGGGLARLADFTRCTRKGAAPLPIVWQRLEHAGQGGSCEVGQPCKTSQGYPTSLQVTGTKALCTLVVTSRRHFRFYAFQFCLWRGRNWNSVVGSLKSFKHVKVIRQAQNMGIIGGDIITSLRIGSGITKGTCSPLTVQS